MPPPGLCPTTARWDQIARTRSNSDTTDRPSEPVSLPELTQRIEAAGLACRSPSAAGRSPRTSFGPRPGEVHLLCGDGPESVDVVHHTDSNHAWYWGRYIDPSVRYGNLSGRHFQVYGRYEVLERLHGELGGRLETRD